MACKSDAGQYISVLRWLKSLGELITADTLALFRRAKSIIQR
eukprot:UN09812